MNVDLNLLRVFLAVYEARSASRAAERLDMSQPGLSTALARLRSLVGDPLFVRTGNGLSPTQRAHDLHRPLSRIIEEVEEHVFGARSFDATTCEKEFSIALSDVGEAIYMPLAIRKLGEVAPLTSLRSVSAAPGQLQRAIEDGTVDCAAGYFPDLHNDRFLHRPIGLHSFACLLRADHPIRGDRIRVADFLAARHIVVAAQGRSQEVFETFLASKGLSRRVGLRTPHFMSLPMIIATTDLVATVPQALADFFVGSYGLRQVRLPFRPPVFQSNLYWSRSVDVQPTHQWLRATLLDAFSVVRQRAYERNGR